MVEKEVKNADPEYYTNGAIKKKHQPLFSNSKTRESKDVQVAKDCKQTVVKEEKEKLGFLDFDAPKEEY